MSDIIIDLTEDFFRAHAMEDLNDNQSKTDLRNLYDAVVYTGSKWRPWRWWTISGAVAGALGATTAALVPGTSLWVIPLIVVLFVAVNSLYRLLERGWMVQNFGGTLLFPTAFSIGFIVPLSLFQSHTVRCSVPW